jgi:predicted small lipoprotein YifL
MRALRLLPFLLLAACGQSGDLYLPPAQPVEPVAAPPAAEAPAADEEKKKDPPEEGP